MRRLLIVLVLGFSACSPKPGIAMADRETFRLGGLTVHEVFADQTVAALAEAACFGDVATVSRMTSTGVNPNGTGKDGLNILSWVIGCQNVAGVEALLNAGANPNQRNGDTFTPVYVATLSPAPHATEILKLLLKHGGDPNTDDLRSHHSAIYQALSRGMDTGRWGSWYALLDGGLDVNRHDEYGNTIAVEAAGLGQFDRVVELLDRGYNYELDYISTRVDRGYTGPDDPQYIWKQRLIERLKKLGAYPPPPFKPFIPKPST